MSLATPDRIRSLQRKLYRKVKADGKPDAGNRHVRFDERGRETGRCRMAQATAPFLDSTKLLASDPDNEYMMIDATIVRAHQHSAGARKKRSASDRPIARRTDHQNSRARRRLGQSRRVDALARPSS